MYAGVPYAPLSPAYSLIATDYGKLQELIAQLPASNSSVSAT